MRQVKESDGGGMGSASTGGRFTRFYDGAVIGRNSENTLEATQGRQGDVSADTRLAARDGRSTPKPGDERKSYGGEWDPSLPYPESAQGGRTRQAPGDRYYGKNQYAATSTGETEKSERCDGGGVGRHGENLCRGHRPSGDHRHEGMDENRVNNQPGPEVASWILSHHESLLVANAALPYEEHRLGGDGDGGVARCPVDRRVRVPMIGPHDEQPRCCHTQRGKATCPGSGAKHRKQQRDPGDHGDEMRGPQRLVMNLKESPVYPFGKKQEIVRAVGRPLSHHRLRT